MLAFLVQCFLASRVKTPAWDETGDIAAGLSYLLTDKFTVNLQHPPLLKELIGLSTLASGARWPKTAAAQQLLAGDARYQWTVGDEIIIANGPENVMFWARLPMILANPGAMVATKDVFSSLRPRGASPIAAGPVVMPAAGGPTEFIAALASLRNELERPAIELAPVIEVVLAALRSSPGCGIARMSGSGATCFGLFENARAAAAAAAKLRANHPSWWIRATRLAG